MFHKVTAELFVGNFHKPFKNFSLIMSLKMLKHIGLQTKKNIFPFNYFMQSQKLSIYKK